MFSGADLLPDLFGGNSIFNIGSYQSLGYTAGVTQDLGEHFSADRNVRFARARSRPTAGDGATIRTNCAP